jgi:hypothetical protein
MTDNAYPMLIFDTPFDERAQMEAKARGYLSNTYVQQSDGSRFPVVFYDCVRLAQDLEYEVSVGRMCVADIGMIVLPEVTLDKMRIAVSRLTAEGYFQQALPSGKGRGEPPP